MLLLYMPDLKYKLFVFANDMKLNVFKHLMKTGEYSHVITLQAKEHDIIYKFQLNSKFDWLIDWLIDWYCFWLIAIKELLYTGTF
jgi:hypothetical protein